jgi:hypothetical protein
MPFMRQRDGGGMRTNELVVVAILGAALAAAAGCAAGVTMGTKERGATLAPEAPPAPLDPYFVDEPGQVWVHARWARIDHQWAWQPGHHEPAQPGKVYVGGRWQRTKNAYEWIDGRLVDERAGHAFAPGHYEHRGSQFVWIMDAWVPQPGLGTVWVAGKWIEGPDARVFVEGHWIEPVTSKREGLQAARPAKPAKTAKPTRKITWR